MYSPGEYCQAFDLICAKRAAFHMRRMIPPPGGSAKVHPTGGESRPTNGRSVHIIGRQVPGFQADG